ncbi:MAG: ubiquinol-cytochrome c reductase iron-sulfur subunit [Gammaproteobacteria bacterium]|nr:ubiquinol-cytochrome c reductase iron-sulfur subunit [Gammaproteobacteria bacterium]
MDADSSRRLNLVRVTKLLSLAAIALLMIPFVGSLFAPEDSDADNQNSAGMVVDLQSLAPGEIRQLAWKGKPVWVYHRTSDDIAVLPQLSRELADPDSRQSEQPPRMSGPWRSEKPEYFVFIPLETRRNCRVHLLPAGEAGAVEGRPWHGGFAEACYGARFDLAGRLYAATGSKDQRNLPVPPHRFIGRTELELPL